MASRLLNRCLTCLFLTAVACMPIAPAFAETIAFKPGRQWKAGDEVRFERSRTRVDAKADRTITARTPVTIKVVATADLSHVVAWRYGRTVLEGAAAGQAEMLESLQDRLEAVDLVVELSRSGEFASLRNWEEVRDRAIAALDNLVAPGMASEPALEKALAQIKDLFATRRGVETFLLREVQGFFMLYGWELDPGESTSYDDQLPNPLGSPPLPAKGTVRLVSADKRQAVLRHTLEFDRSQAGKALADSLAALAQRMGKPVPERELNAIATSLDVRDEAELTLDLATRWPTRLVHERRIKLGDRSRVDRVEYRRN